MMESRILNVSNTRSAQTSAHYVSARGNGGYTNSLQRYTTEKSIRNLQYNIPAVGHHYGNAFAPDDDDENGDEEEIGRFLIPSIGVYGQSLNMINTVTDCCEEDDEEADDDVEMSPAIEVISIDPNCDYDSYEEEDDHDPVQLIPQPVDVRQVQISDQIIMSANVITGKNCLIERIETVTGTDPNHINPDLTTVTCNVVDGLDSDEIEPELQNLHRDSEEEDADEALTANRESRASSSNSSSSRSSSSSDSISSNSNSSRSSSSSSNNSCRNSNNSSRSSNSDSSSSSMSSSSSHPSDYVNPSDQEATAHEHQKNLSRIIERRKRIAIERRRNRTSSTNRNSFSLPQSPVAAVDNNLMHDITSLSFEDLDMSGIVDDLSPIKNTVHGRESDKKLVDELAVNNFDLAAYIGATEDGCVASETNVQQQQTKSVSPKKSHPKSRGKQIKILRELLISPKPNDNEADVIKRSCTIKSRRIVENSDTETEKSEQEEDNEICANLFTTEKNSLVPKRKKDDMKADPTWNPSGIISTKPTPQRIVQTQKATSVSSSSIAVLQSPSKPMDTEISTKVGKTNDSNKPANSSNNKQNKQLTAGGSQLARNKMMSLMAKNKHTLHTSKQSSKDNTKTSGRCEELSKRKPTTNSNIKLDHDYCSPKKGISQGAPAPAPPRKAIEIPFLLPTVDQLRRKKKLLKSKKRLDSKKENKQTGDKCDKLCNKIEISKSMATSGSAIDKTDVSSVSTAVIKKEIKQECEDSISDICNPAQPHQKQMSLLKINHIKQNEVQPETRRIIKQEIMDDNSLMDANEMGRNNESAVKVKKKINIQEYKKRREFPNEDIVSPVPVVENGSKVSTSTASASTELNIVPTARSNEQQSNTGKEENGGQIKCKNKTPLDPISAAKLKALRMQQLKKEAAIKSTEAKIIPKIVPEIVPLVEITSIKFDEHGNPMPYDKAAENNSSEAKLQDDYEEIIIVSIGCNTQISIKPSEDMQKTGKSSTAESEKNIPKNELLSNIKDTIKRCQSSAPTIISSSSLISSIQEVVIKKGTCNKTDTGDTVTGMKKHTMSGGQVNQQCSPNIGISPPNAYSPGKPEKAGGTYEQSLLLNCGDHDLQLTANEVKSVEHGENKIIMHLRKDRPKPKSLSIGIQTLPLDKFPPLAYLTPRKQERTISRSSCDSTQRTKSRQSTEKNRGRSYRVYRKRRSRSSSSEHESRKTVSSSHRSSTNRSRRSRSRCKSRRRSRSRSRSFRRRSRSTSCRRKSSISSERHNSHDREYSRRDRNTRRHRSRSMSTDYSSSSRHSSHARSLSRSSRSRSRSSSRHSPQNRNRSRIEYRRQTSSPERKIVYVGRLEPSLTREELRRKFIQYGRINQVTLHYKDSGAKYGFVTFDKPQDAYKAIDASSSDQNVCNYDVSFGGRRAFCRTRYADLDGDLSQDQEPIPYIASDGSYVMTPNPTSVIPRKNKAESFEDMLKKLKKEINSKKPRKS